MEMVSNGRDQGAKAPSNEVVAKATRRRFSAKYKLTILRKADACTESGEIGALLRREGLFSSHLAKWRKQRDAGQLEGLTSRRRGPKPSSDAAAVRELEQVRRENERLRKRLKDAETIISFQKKVSEVLGIATEIPNDEKS